MTYLDALNPEQREAVLHEGSPLLILAGAGSGKTRVITTKIAYLIRERGVSPHSILAVTFTNKAAREMRERAMRIEPRAEGAMLRTFHSFGAWFLRLNAEAAGLPSNFNIYDDEDSASLAQSVMRGADKKEARSMAHRIARAKDYFLDPDSERLGAISHTKEFREVYGKYEKRLKDTGNVDFGDLIKKPVEILRQRPEIKARVQDRFRVIMVDEYQDANIAQFELLRALYAAGTYICVVGDDDQSIYSFRGAEVQNILQFPSKFDEVKIVRLVRNYRSVSPILDLASAVVTNNTGRLGKTLIAERGGERVPRLIFVENQDEEAKFSARLIEKQVDNGKGGYDDWAVLYRTNAQSLAFETEFLQRGIPYRIVGTVQFYEREEVKDALSLLALLHNPRDEIAFRRMVNKPARGLGAKTVDAFLESNAGGNLLDALLAALPSFSAKAKAGAKAFVDSFTKARSALTANAYDDEIYCEDAETGSRAPSVSSRASIKGGEGLSLCAAILLTEAGIPDYHYENDELKGEARIANLQELVNSASLYEASASGLAEFLEHIELGRSIESQNEEAEAVTLITLHNTKGLEFRKVILSGVEQGIFPRFEKIGAELEEERRLFYVGVTRAMDELYITSCKERRVFGRTQEMHPSVFLHEAKRCDMLVLGEKPAEWERDGGY